MALPSRAGHRRSFADARNDGRRMEMTWHEDARVVVVSLWQDTTCRSTFRMPIEDAPAMIGILSSALGDAAAAPRSERTASERPARARHRDAANVAELLRRLLRRRRAEIVPLTATRGGRDRDVPPR